jgi:cholesterol oxidase
MQGIFKLTIFKHVAVLSGTGVGGGSLVYANTLPVPKKPFFQSGSWKNLLDWEQELKPFYAIAKKMLGASTHPYMSRNDKAMSELANEMGNPAAFEKTDVAVFFGKPLENVADPFFDGNGPDRAGCNQCGGCMLGCRNNAKNTLDKNYLHLAQQKSCEILAESEVLDVIPHNADGSEGYTVKFRKSFSFFSKIKSVRCKFVVFSGGVLGTMDLLLKLKSTSLPNLSDSLGKGIRTNSESLIGVTSFDKDADFSKGIAIGSIVNIDENRHVEPVKYSEGSGFWRLLMAPMVQGDSVIVRIGKMLQDFLRYPLQNLKAYFIDDWSKRTHILLYMESIDSTLRMKRSAWGFNKTELEEGNAPTAFNPVAQDIARRIEKIINGKAMVMAHETLTSWAVHVWEKVPKRALLIKTIVFLTIKIC